MKPLLECVPNFSEGRNPVVIEQIAQAIRSVSGVKLLAIDSGYSANRTVMTFVGEPRCVIRAAFRAIRKAAELIDMSKQQGVHPRMGATDVCPLVPIQEVSLKEANEYAYDLARRVGEELRIPVYLYEHSAHTPARKNLAHIRSGEYEGFKKKIYLKEWEPDHGPVEFNERAGQTVIGVRDFLIAYNINLNTKDSLKANKIAREIRESGYIKVQNGKKLKDEEGNWLRVQGSCKGVKAIGWYMEEFGIAQVSTNITDSQASPVHRVFEEAAESARRHGLRVTGSELVGMIPREVLLEAGFYYLELQGSSPGLSEREVLEVGVKSLGLAELKEFRMEEKVLEYAIEKAESYESGQGANFARLLNFYELNPSDPAVVLSISLYKCLQRIAQAIGYFNQYYESEKKPGKRKIWGVKAIVFQRIKKDLQNILDSILRANKEQQPLEGNMALGDTLLLLIEEAWLELGHWNKEEKDYEWNQPESCFYSLERNLLELAELLEKVLYRVEAEEESPVSELISKMGNSMLI